MDENPYKVLGVDENASIDEVKKAYRKKARENHPDLNPDDPNAAQRMNEINEAYDRIMNPEKYAASDRRRAQSSTSSGGYSTTSTGGYSSGRTSYGGYGQQTRQGSYGYGGSRGWTGDFDFDDFFGGYGGFAGRVEPIHPEPSNYDSAEMISAINLINSNHPLDALKILNSIPSTNRNARWHYISAIANKYAGNEVRSIEHIRKALQSEPNNADYQRAQAWIQQSAQTYQTHGGARGFSTFSTNAGLLCCSMWVCGPFLCNYCRLCGF